MRCDCELTSVGLEDSPPAPALFCFLSFLACCAFGCFWFEAPGAAALSFWLISSCLAPSVRSLTGSAPPGAVVAGGWVAMMNMYVREDRIDGDKSRPRHEGCRVFLSSRPTSEKTRQSRCLAESHKLTRGSSACPSANTTTHTLPSSYTLYTSHISNTMYRWSVTVISCLLAVILASATTTAADLRSSKPLDCSGPLLLGDDS